jgi:nickel-type superoxide dismutase maturation protease
VLAAAALLAAGPAAARLGRGWALRGAVTGTSMLPLLRPGDWLLLDPDAYRRRPPRPGELVVVRDPREPARLLAKRVVAEEPDGRLDLAGDNPGQSTDSRTFGPVPAASVLGRPWVRYWPPRRWGRVR